MKLLIVSLVCLAVLCSSFRLEHNDQKKDHRADETAQTYNLDETIINGTISKLQDNFLKLLKVLLDLVNLVEKNKSGFMQRLDDRIQKYMEEEIAEKNDSSRRMYKMSRSESFSACLEREQYLNTVLVDLAQTSWFLNMYFEAFLEELKENESEVQPDSNENEDSKEKSGTESPEDIGTTETPVTTYASNPDRELFKVLLRNQLKKRIADLLKNK